MSSSNTPTRLSVRDSFEPGSAYGNRSQPGDWLIFPPIHGLACDHSLSVAVNSTGKNVPVPLAVSERLPSYVAEHQRGFRLVELVTGREIAHMVELAAGFWSRLVGLQFRRRLPHGRGLLIVPCRSIHTCFVRFALDVVFMDRQGVVLEVCRDVRPWRIVAGHRQAHAVLELPSGAAWLQPAQTLAVAVRSDPVALPRAIGFLPRFPTE